MRLLVIHNPRAGRQRPGAGVERAGARWRAAGWEVDVQATRERGDGRRLAARAASGTPAYDCVVAAGGDGTIHEVVNGLLSAQGTPCPIPIGVLPLGTGCDFARNLGILGGIDEAIARVIGGTVRPTDVLQVTRVGGVDERRAVYAVNSVSVGLGGRVVARANAATRLKRLLGSRVFLWAAVWEIVRAPRYHARLELDGRALDEMDLATVVASNGAYFGGAMHVAPEASLYDGRLDVVRVRSGPRGQLLRALGSVYHGAHLTHPLVRMSRGARLVVTPLGGEPMLVEVDGESLGTAPVAIHAIAGALLVRS